MSYLKTIRYVTENMSSFYIYERVHPTVIITFFIHFTSDINKKVLLLLNLESNFFSTIIYVS